MIYTTGHIEPFWDESFKNFSYSKKEIEKSEIDTWVSQGYDYVKSFSGSLYSNNNPMPSWVSNLDNHFGLKNQTYCFYVMKTLEIMPTHTDKYHRYQELFNCPANKVYRVILMLEDWKPGHYFEMAGKGYVNWRAGDYFKWNNDCPHGSANIGIENRYTLQITG
ncbi:hypothetical protein EBU71_14980, partial [bacterium]|nr:hypothetical protein [Candidatus Elulimicrobium humile]